jgi:hypothetical protein
MGNMDTARAHGVWTMGTMDTVRAHGPDAGGGSSIRLKPPEKPDLLFE